MKTKTLLILLLVETVSLLCALSGDLNRMMDDLLKRNPAYQQAVNKLDEEKALFSIDNSLNWFDLNLRYQKYVNDIQRDETEIVLEHSDIDETDRRWRVELDKQFFPKDFGTAIDYVSSRIDLMRYGQELKLSRLTCTADIFDDLINWQENTQMISLLQSQLDLLYQQNSVLEGLDRQNQLGPDLLIDNLEGIENKEADLSNRRKDIFVYESIYGDILPAFQTGFQAYMASQVLPDTLTFRRQIQAESIALQKEAERINRRIRLKYWGFFLPEVNITFSYNWRDTDQDWDITKNNLPKVKTVRQNEAFPEGILELSLPFDIFSNSKGKLALLKGYRQELNFRSEELELTWQNLAAERLKCYHAASQEIRRKARLAELYEHSLNLDREKFRTEPSLLGTSPELALQKSEINASVARLKQEVAAMKLYKEIYIINSLGGEN